MNGSKAKRSWTPSPLETRASKRAQRMAEQASGRVPWPELLKAQRQYVRWNTFALWAQAIEETEGSLPYEFARSAEQRAPGFLRFAAEFEFHHPHAHHPNTFLRMLDQWIEEHVFQTPRNDGWMFAVRFYAVRHLTSLRDEAYFDWCRETWKQSKPRAYPSFEEWRIASEHVSGDILDQVEMRDDRRELIKLCRGIRPRALELAIERYVDWVVCMYWARPALEELRPLPKVVEIEIEERCPGFLGLHGSATTLREILKDLSRWIDEHAFCAAKDQGWLEVLRYQMRLHPRSMRARSFWRHWTAEWTRRGHRDYPSPEAWSRELETYTFEATR